MYDPGKEHVAPFSVVIAVLPHRVLLDVMTVFDDTAGTTDVMAARSVDGGRTWSRPALIAHGSASEAIDPDAGTRALGTVITSVAVGPDGVPTVAWNDIASPHSSRVLASRSRDGGRSWSRPVAVSRVPGQAIQADVAAARDGTLGITWYDDRRDPGGSKAAWNFDVWFAFSRDRGRSWRRMHLAGPFDMNRAQALEGAGRRIGDYQTLAGLPHGFAAIFTQAPPQAKIGASDVFFARVRTGH